MPLRLFAGKKYYWYYNLGGVHWVVTESIHILPQVAFGNSKVEGGSQLWNSQGMGGKSIFRISTGGGEEG